MKAEHIDDTDPRIPMVRQLADETLKYLFYDRKDDAKKPIYEIANDFGSWGLGVAILHWVDRVNDAMFEPDEDPDRTQFGYVVHESSGEFEVDADDIPPSVKWTTQLMIARARDDESKYCELLEYVNGLGPEFTTEYVSMLIQVVAMNIKLYGGEEFTEQIAPWLN